MRYLRKMWKQFIQLKARTTLYKHKQFLSRLITLT